MVLSSLTSQFKVLDIERISERLFRQKKIRQKLCRDFSIEDVGDPVTMADSLVNSMGQIAPRDGGVSGCVKARINGEQRIPHPAICGAGDGSERWVRV